MDIDVAVTIKTLLAQQPHAPESDVSRIPDGLNLLDFIDSFAFAHLLMEIESRLGLSLDLQSVDLAELTQLDALCDLVSSQLQSGAVKVAQTPVEVTGP